jgi:hypothetical protein
VRRDNAAIEDCKLGFVGIQSLLGFHSHTQACVAVMYSEDRRHVMNRSGREGWVSEILFRLGSKKNEFSGMFSSIDLVTGVKLGDVVEFSDGIV